MATYQQLKAQAEALLKQAETARRQEIASVVAEIQAKMKEYGISVNDLRGSARGSGKRGTVAAKYKDPTTGATWSGRGRAPKWLADELAKGKSKDAFLIK
ncbi:MAG TPA: H-NS histone family protein [Thiobacillaceae bacterium]|nr:H-NS histone family protein [Thiobacillaceae bacterium]